MTGCPRPAIREPVYIIRFRHIIIIIIEIAVWKKKIHVLQFISDTILCNAKKFRLRKKTKPPGKKDIAPNRLVNFAYEKIGGTLSRTRVARAWEEGGRKYNNSV